MAVTEPGEASKGAQLVARVRGLLTQPSEEWRAIAGETTAPRELVVGYLLPLVAAAALAMVIGFVVFGFGVPGLASVRLPIWLGLVQAIVYAGLTVGMTLLMGLVVNALAPSFDARPGQQAALKVAIYASTGMLLGGLFQIFPALGVLGLIGLVWSIVLLHGGLKILMQTPEAKAAGFTAAVVGIMALLWLVAGVVTSSIITGPMMANSILASGQVRIGGAEIDVAGMERAAQEAERAMAQMESRMQEAAGEGAADLPPAVEVDALKRLLPERLPGGFQRVSLETASGGAMGLGLATVTGRYEAGGGRAMEVSVGDLGPMGAAVGMAGALGVTSETETSDGYERVRTEAGRMVTESLSRSGGTAEYALVLKSRFVLSASGSGGVDAAAVKAAVEAVGPGRLEKMAQ